MPLPMPRGSTSGRLIIKLKVPSLTKEISEQQGGAATNNNKKKRLSRKDGILSSDAQKQKLRKDLKRVSDIDVYALDDRSTNKLQKLVSTFLSSYSTSNLVRDASSSDSTGSTSEIDNGNCPGVDVESTIVHPPVNSATRAAALPKMSNLIAEVKQIKRDAKRKEARDAVEKMVNTVQFCDNKEVFKDLLLLAGGEEYNPYALNDLGLFLKEDAHLEEEEEEEEEADELEEGEIR